MSINPDGNVGIGTTNATAKLEVSGSILTQGVFGTSFTKTGNSGSTAIYDTFTTSGGGEVYEFMASGDPNSAGSSAYRDILFGKIFIGTGWNGSAVTQYINYVQENPDPRSLYNSGASTSLSASVFFKYSTTESTNKPDGTVAKIRVRIGSYASSGVTGDFTTVRLKRLL
jgi:hypothetical protein